MSDVFDRSARDIAVQIERLLANLPTGTLRFYGHWFGRPMDNIHRVLSARAQGNQLIVSFDEGEVLTVWNPEEFVGGARVFRINRASRVKWEWYSYGEERIPSNLKFWDYSVNNEVLCIASKETMYNPVPQPANDLPAVEIVPLPG